MKMFYTFILTVVFTQFAVAQSAKQLTDKEAREYTTENIFANCNSAMACESNWFKDLPAKPFVWPAVVK